jgi:hypothetical protein
MMLTSRHAPLTWMGVALACATASSPARGPSAPSARFADLGSIVIADSGEGKPQPGTFRVTYPELQRDLGVEAEFAFAYVVDTSGKTEYQTISFIGDVQPPFVAAMCRWLRTARFERVRREGVATRALIVGDISFTLARSRQDAEQVAPMKRVDGERLRRSFRARGITSTTQELESHRHCQ